MQYFIGITPPEEVKRLIIAFQKSFGSNKVPNNVEPHITLKAQGGLTEDLSWLPKVETALETFQPFEVVLDGIDTFNETILFLDLPLQDELVHLHKKLVRSIQSNKQTKKFFEHDNYHAHLTLGGIAWGMTKDELATMREKAKELFSSPLSFEASFVRVYQRESPHGTYNTMKDIWLG